MASNYDCMLVKRIHERFHDRIYESAKELF